MRVYEVQPGDTPAKIAIVHAGCPKCARDLIHSNVHKATRTLPNGFITFEELRVGEKLNLPDKWWSKEFDELPPSYFAALPHPDGVTMPKLGVGAAPAVAPQAQGLSTGEIAALALLGVATVSGAIYLATRNEPEPPRVRRVRPGDAP